MQGVGSREKGVGGSALRLIFGGVDSPDSLECFAFLDFSVCATDCN